MTGIEITGLWRTTIQ